MEYIGDVIYDGKLADKDNKLVIFGAGVYGRKVLRYLELNGLKDSIVCFCDSNETLVGQNIRGIPVCMVNDVCEKYADAVYLVSGVYAKEMLKILMEKNICKIHLFHTICGGEP